MKNILTLLRVHHYIKNVFIILPLFFALEIHHIDKLIAALISFAGFSLLASSVYIFNDLLDIKSDQQHPVKKNRPLPKGSITVKTAVALLSFCFIGGVLIASSLSESVLFFSLSYIFINIAYTLWLKHIAILDISCIAAGFVARLFVGSYATGVTLSIWIISMTFLLALFLAMAKRRDDVLIFLETGKKMRKVVDGYNLSFVNTSMMVMSSVVIVFYSMYTVSADVIEKTGSDKLFFTTAFVIISILRYLQLTLVYNKSGNPTEMLLKDPFLQATISGWLLTFGIILYL